MSDLERIALFIDGANLYASAKSLGFNIDYKRLLKEFQAKGRLIRAFYYTALVEDQEYSSIRPLVDWLDYNGYAVVTKPTKEFVDSTGRRKVKGNMDIELAVAAMEMADHIDHMVLFSGDGDFRSLVEAVQRKGVRVSVVSTVATQPAMVADELRRQADEFVDLTTLAPRIGRDPAERARARAEACGAPRSPPYGGRDDVGRRRGRSAPRMTRAPRVNETSAAFDGGPGRDCALCPRLAAFSAANRAALSRWVNAPVASSATPQRGLLIVGLAPGLRGANRTGRPFTGDYAGDLLYETLMNSASPKAFTIVGPTTACASQIARSPTPCAASRRRTSRRRRKSPIAARFWTERSRRCRVSGRCWRSAASLMKACCGRSAPARSASVRSRRAPRPWLGAARRCSTATIAPDTTPTPAC